ncbi:hypothetical protein PG996_005848 [Apiospora saccharicola]|uniref:Uncharacterized protein n=1 Tax=Apiospora saccharicola TaxID=335842 RepID=A0ABR1VQL0_9PEZI
METARTAALQPAGRFLQEGLIEQGARLLGQVDVRIRGRPKADGGLDPNKSYESGNMRRHDEEMAVERMAGRSGQDDV